MKTFPTEMSFPEGGGGIPKLRDEGRSGEEKGREKRGRVALVQEGVASGIR